MIFSSINFFLLQHRQSTSKTFLLLSSSFFRSLSLCLLLRLALYIYRGKKKERRSMAAGGYLLLFLLLLEDNKLPKFPIIQLFILSRFFLFSLSSDSFILYFRYLMYVCNAYIDSFGLANRHRPLEKMNSVHSCVSGKPTGQNTRDAAWIQLWLILNDE